MFRLFLFPSLMRVIREGQEAPERADTAPNPRFFKGLRGAELPWPEQVKEGHVLGKRPSQGCFYSLRKKGMSEEFGTGLFYLVEGGEILRKNPKKAAGVNSNIDSSEVSVLRETPNPGNFKGFSGFVPIPASSWIPLIPSS